jgi:hypothetical protein
MEILLLHRGNVNNDIRTGDNHIDVCLKLCILIREENALSCPVNVMAMEDATCRLRRIRWISYMITHQPALVRFLLQQDFLRVQYGILCTRISCILSKYTQWPGDKHICLQFLQYVLDKTVDTLQFLCCVCDELTRQYLQEVVYTSYTTCTNRQWRILRLLISPHSSRDLVSTLGPES